MPCQSIDGRGSWIGETLLAAAMVADECSNRASEAGGVWRSKPIMMTYRMPVVFLRVRIKIFGQIKFRTI